MHCFTSTNRGGSGTLSSRPARRVLAAADGRNEHQSTCEDPAFCGHGHRRRSVHDRRLWFASWGGPRSSHSTTGSTWLQTGPFVPAGQADAPIACRRPAPDNRVSTQLHCMTPAQMRAAYGITDQYGGEGQTIVLVDSFGSPTAAEDLNFFAQTFGMPTPDSEQCSSAASPGSLDGQGNATGQGSGQNGPSSARAGRPKAANPTAVGIGWPPGAHRPPATTPPKRRACRACPRR